MKLTKLVKLSLLAMLVALLTACAPNLNSNTYDYYGGQASRVREGVIQDIQYNVNVRRNTGVGAVAGGVAGGVIGSNLGGGNGVVGIVGTVGGAVLGGMAGHSIENSAGTSQATLYIVRLIESHRLVSVIQQNRLPLCKGDHVYLIGAGDRPHLKLNDNYYSSGEHSRSGCFSNH